MCEPKNPGGYILVSRKMIESEIWEKPPIYLKVWMYLLLKAQHKPYKNLKRGQVIVSIPELIEECSYKVGYRTERPKKSQIYNVLDWLRSSNETSNEGNAREPMIKTTKTTRGLIVTISNYNVYQDSKNYEQNKEMHKEAEPKETRTKRQPNTINKNVKNLRIKELKNSSTTTTTPEEDISEIIQTFESSLCRLSPMQIKSLWEWFDELNGNKEIILEAIKIADDRNKRSFGFVEYLLKEWSNNNLSNIEQIQAHERNKFQKPNGNTYKSRKPIRSEQVPGWLQQQQQQEKETEQSNVMDLEAERARLLAIQEKYKKENKIAERV